MTTPNKPLISVIMPAYNCESYITQAIDSILNQTHQNLELLIIDDGSTDNTWDTINTYSDERIKATRNPINLGYLKTSNKIFDICRGKYIAFQDADDWSHPTRLELQIELLTKKQDLAFCGTGCTKFFDDGFKTKAKYPQSTRAIKVALSLGITSLFCGSSIVMRSSILKKLGHYREFFDRIGAEDIDWYLRGLELGRAENIQENLYYYRQHNTSISASRTKEIAKRCIDIAYALHLERKEYGIDSITKTSKLREKLERKMEEKSTKKPPIFPLPKRLTTSVAGNWVTKKIIGKIRTYNAIKIKKILESLHESPY